jgi:hypothetical protein
MLTEKQWQDDEKDEHFFPPTGPTTSPASFQWDEISENPLRHYTHDCPKCDSLWCTWQEKEEINSSVRYFLITCNDCDFTGTEPV